MKEDANRFNGLLAEQLREQVGNLMAAAQLLTPAIREQEALLQGDGRILVRPSGTEALLRVMVEASLEETAQSVANTLAEIIKNAQK